MQSEMQSGLIRRSKGSKRYHSVGGSATHAPSSLVTDAPDAALGATVVDETALALRTEAPSMALCVMDRKRRRGTLRLLSTTPIAVHGQAGESSRAKAPDEGGHRHAIGEAFSEGKSSRSRLMMAI